MEQFNLIIAIVNTGFSEIVMDAAREEGAKGGTIIHARGTGTKAMEEKYGIEFENEEMSSLVTVSDVIKAVELKTK